MSINSIKTMPCKCTRFHAHNMFINRTRTFQEFAQHLFYLPVKLVLNRAHNIVPWKCLWKLYQKHGEHDKPVLPYTCVYVGIKCSAWHFLFKDFPKDCTIPILWNIMAMLSYGMDHTVCYVCFDFGENLWWVCAKRIFFSNTQIQWNIFEAHVLKKIGLNLFSVQNIHIGMEMYYR